MIPVTLSHSKTTETLTFSVDPALLQSADAKLAAAIITSIDESNGNYGHFFSEEKYDIHAWDLSCEKSNAAFINAAIKAEKEARLSNNIDGYKGYLDTYLSRVLTSLANTDYDAATFYSDAASTFFYGLDMEIIKSLSELKGVDSDIESEAFERLLMEAIEDKLANNDKSVVTDLITNGRAEFVFAKGFNWDADCVEDKSTGYNDVCSTVETIEVDDRLQPLFDMTNVSVDGFVEYLASENVGSAVLERYRKLEDNYNEELPPLMSFESIAEIIGNAGYGGLPMFTAFVSARDFILRDITKGIFFDSGVIGLEDLCNGSGHNVSISNGSKLYISPKELSSMAASLGVMHYPRDEVYCYSRSALYAEVEQVRCT